MAPRRRHRSDSPKTPDNFEYLRSLGEFKKTIRRRDTLKSFKSSKVPGRVQPARPAHRQPILSCPASRRVPAGLAVAYGVVPLAASGGNSFKNKAWRRGGDTAATLPKLRTISSTLGASVNSKRPSGGETHSSPSNPARCQAESSLHALLTANQSCRVRLHRGSLQDWPWRVLAGVVLRWRPWGGAAA
ncbi:hypothetical protein O3P69_009262 [Scylla paramamosain]|uniref:Uncharacterized protein n=1 Tax=Scylla paramamosain TaxID=85552 RepID=A0AAW0TAY2_SCYPA